MKPNLWYVHGSPLLTDIAVKAWERFGEPIYQEPEPILVTGEMAPFYKFAPSLQVIDTGAYLHSDMEDASMVPWTGLQVITRAYAKIVNEVNRFEIKDLNPGGASSYHHLSTLTSVCSYSAITKFWGRGVTRVLKDIRVIELGTFITGPSAGMLLADFGADVIKLEQPGKGDPFRSYEGAFYGPQFLAYNARKRSMTLNLKAPRAREVFERLVADADVLIENYRPGVLDDLGYGWLRLHALNPRLVYLLHYRIWRCGALCGRSVLRHGGAGFAERLSQPNYRSGKSAHCRAGAGRYGKRHFRGLRNSWRACRTRTNRRGPPCGSRDAR